MWLGTPLLFYTYIAPPMSHACSAFAVALFVTVWLRVRRAWTPAGVVMLGLCGGLMAMVREQDAFFALGPALDFALTRFAAPGPRLRGLATAAAGCAAFALALAPQLLSYSRLNGYARPSKLVARKMTWTAPHAWEVLFSTAHGYVFWTPLAVLALSGLVVLAARRGGDIRRIALILLLMAALQVYVGGSVESWSVAGAFGQRRFVALSVLLVVGLAALWQAFPKGSWRTALLAASVVCVWWNLSLTALFGTGMMNRKRLELARNAYDAFVTLPRVGPQLAWRYVFDRQSFYRNVPPPRVP
jgi:hypothetical protein